jgi:hypothetical protein
MFKILGIKNPIPVEVWDRLFVGLIRLLEMGYLLIHHSDKSESVVFLLWFVETAVDIQDAV